MTEEKPPTSAADSGPEWLPLGFLGKFAPLLVLAALIGIPAGALAYEQLHLEVAGVTSPAPGTRTFEIVAYQWGFQPANITVHPGDHVRLLLTSRDVTHGFQIPQYRIDAEIHPGKWTSVEFTADKPGTFTFQCSVICAATPQLVHHFLMTGKLVVEP